MNVHYSEITFAIDLIADAYKISDINTIQAKIKNDLGMDISKAQIHDYLNHAEDYEMVSNSISMKEHFKQEEYEW